MVDTIIPKVIQIIDEVLKEILVLIDSADLDNIQTNIDELTTKIFDIGREIIDLLFGEKEVLEVGD